MKNHAIPTNCLLRVGLPTRNQNHMSVLAFAVALPHHHMLAVDAFEARTKRRGDLCSCASRPLVTRVTMPNTRVRSTPTHLCREFEVHPIAVCDFFAHNRATLFKFFQHVCRHCRKKIGEGEPRQGEHWTGTQIAAYSCSIWSGGQIRLGSTLLNRRRAFKAQVVCAYRLRETQRW